MALVSVPKICDLEPGLGSVPELTVAPGLRPGMTNGVVPFYKAWPGGRAKHTELSQGVGCADDAEVVSRVHQDVIGGASKRASASLREIREMEAEMRAFQLHAECIKAERLKEVARILSAFNSKAEGEGEGEEGERLEKGRRAAELLRQLQVHGQQRCEEIIAVEQWHDANRTLGEQVGERAHPWIHRPFARPPGVEWYLFVPVTN
jgi:hypothetical protein